MANCQLLKNQLDLLIEERISVEKELHSIKTPSERGPLLTLLRNLNREIALKRTQYNNCLHPPAPKPDLVAKTFQIRPHHAERTMDVACVFQNNGDGPARGPFVVTLGVTFKNEKGATITRQLDFKIPAGTTIEGHGTQFTTESMTNISLLYRNEHPDAVYLLEMIVDANNQVSEVNESNNRLSLQYWTLRPGT